MAETDKGALDGIRDLLARFVDQMQTREEVVRLDERMKQVATREEVNNGDFRTLQEVSTMFDRSSAATQQYVRDRVEESSLKTQNALQGMERHILEKVEAGINKAAAAAAAATIAAMPPIQPPMPGQGEQYRRMNPIVPWVGGPGIGGLVVYLILAFFGWAPRPGG